MNTERLGYCARCGRLVPFPLFWSHGNWEMDYCSMCRTEEDLKSEIEASSEIMREIKDAQPYESVNIDKTQDGGGD